MKFSSREDIEAPVSTVFEAVTDFDRFERQLLRRGVDITRDESTAPTDIGANWKAQFPWRGRTHDVAAELVTFDRESGFAFESRSGGVVCMGVVDLVALSKSRTRLFVSLDLRPTTLSSRLFIQSLKIAKGSLSRRFKARVSDWAAGLET